MNLFLKGWGLCIRRILTEELTTLGKMEEISSPPANLLERKSFIQTKTPRLMEQEELYWHKRSNLTWLLNGDLTQSSFIE